jgi:hypothetical protein
LHRDTHAKLRKIAAFWGVSMLETIDRLVSQAWAEAQQKEQQDAPHPHDSLHPAR